MSILVQWNAAVNFCLVLELLNNQAKLTEGQWTQWTPWTECSATCGRDVLRKSYRQCQSSSCPNTDGGHIREEKCFEFDCDCEGHLTEWSGWSFCNQQCMQERTRECQLDDPSKNCLPELCVGITRRPQKCYGGFCCERGIWSAWQWQRCGRDCLKNATRQCHVKDQCVDKTPYCPGERSQSQKCFDGDCCDTWTEWSHWDPCDSTTCKTRRTRRCNHNSQGRCPCVGLTFQEIDCELRPHCCDRPVMTWQDWTMCDSKCLQQRKQVCQVTGNCFNSKCPDNYKRLEKRACSRGYCCDSVWGSWGEWSGCNYECKRERNRTSNSYVCRDRSPKSVEDCYGGDCCDTANWNEWQAWSSCSVSCGQGIITRRRTCNKDKCWCVDTNGDRSFAENITLRCASACCEDESIEPTSKEAWSAWSQCSVTCGQGLRSRSRTCNTGEVLHQEDQCPLILCSEAQASSTLGLALGGTVGVLVIAVAVAAAAYFLIYKRRCLRRGETFEDDTEDNEADAKLFSTPRRSVTRDDVTGSVRDDVKSVTPRDDVTDTTSLSGTDVDAPPVGWQEGNMVFISRPVQRVDTDWSELQSSTSKSRTTIATDTTT